MNKFKDIFICTTDTVTGLGINIYHENPNLIYELKNREPEKKLIIVVGSIEQARSLKFWSKEAEVYAKKYWPGAVTLIVNDQGIRMPNNLKLQQFILEEGPFYLTSANKSGKNPIDIKDSRNIFPEIEKIYDFGAGSGKSSIIIDIKTGKRLR